MNTKILIKKRATGKTTGLLYTSEATGYPIIVENEIQVRNLKARAEAMDIIIPEPMTVQQFRERRRGMRHPEHILIDEGYKIISDALTNYFGTNVMAVTISDYIKEDYYMRQHFSG